MKKILILATLTLFFLSCSNKENEANIDALIASKDIKKINEKKALLQADLLKLDEALATLDVKKPKL